MELNANNDLVTVGQAELDEHIENFGRYPRGKSEFTEIDLKDVLEDSFASGKGVIQLSARMTDEQILALIKSACTWSKGKAFQVVPPNVTTCSGAEEKHGIFD